MRRRMLLIKTALAADLPIHIEAIPKLHRVHISHKDHDAARARFNWLPLPAHVAPNNYKCKNKYTMRAEELWVIRAPSYRIEALADSRVFLS